MINVIPIGDTEMNCSEAEISSVLNWLNRPFEMMFLDSWDIQYKDVNSSIIGLKMAPGYKDKYSLLRSYHGVMINEMDNVTVDFIIEELKKEMPITVFGDMYWIPWYSEKYYFKQHAPGHAFTVLGYNKADNSFTCMDSNFSKLYQTIDYDLLNQSLNGCLIYSIESENSDWGLKKNREIILQHLGKLDDSKCLDVISKIAELAKTGFDIKNEFDGFELENVPIFVRIKKIANGRMLFSRSLNYVGKRYNDILLIDYAIRIRKMTNAWLLLRNYLMRMYLSKSSREIDLRIVIHEKLQKIANQEKEILRKLIFDLKSLI
ncbi:hypothetical protein HNR77_003877 [Paenibacillus sp. JGP012]|uniref:hypothetical protein n=1 Tax=Paenibacillus sp. JGP012 TaxID=2735914 RepID=UPI001614D706|nr:hypothetical protein [Paenibacillus sp. JGP012]MBB6022778.1 hypothetical protein [Paenibacillus sp. JGP012]